MAGLGSVSASYELDGEICTVLIPGWPTKPRVEAREDGRNEVAITVAKCHTQEAWRLVRLRKGILCAIVYLTGGRSLEGRRLSRADYDMLVQLPPDLLGRIRVLTQAPDSTDK